MSKIKDKLIDTEIEILKKDFLEKLIDKFTPNYKIDDLTNK
jgi:hypothetical protein